MSRTVLLVALLLASAARADGPARDLIGGRDASGETPLHWAAGNGLVDDVKLLLDRGAAINAVDNLKRTPLVFAAEQGQMETVRLLLARHADVTLADTQNQTVLYYAAAHGWTDVVGLVLARGEDPNRAGQPGRDLTPLMLAALGRHLDTVQTLVTHGARVDLRDGRGFTPLFYAAAGGDERVVTALLRAHADPRARATKEQKFWFNETIVSGRGVTPLMVAASAGSPEAVTALLQGGADAAAKDEHGLTAADIARGRGNTAALSALSAHGPPTDRVVAFESDLIAALSACRSGGEQSCNQAVNNALLAFGHGSPSEQAQAAALLRDFAQVLQLGRLNSTFLNVGSATDPPARVANAACAELALPAARLQAGRLLFAVARASRNVDVGGEESAIVTAYTCARPLIRRDPRLAALLFHALAGFAQGFAPDVALKMLQVAWMLDAKERGAGSPEALSSGLDLARLQTDREQLEPAHRTLAPLLDAVERDPTRRDPFGQAKPSWVDIAGVAIALAKKDASAHRAADADRLARRLMSIDPSVAQQDSLADIWDAIGRRDLALALRRHYASWREGGLQAQLGSVADESTKLASLREYIDTTDRVVSGALRGPSVGAAEERLAMAYVLRRKARILDATAGIMHSWRTLDSARSHIALARLDRLRRDLADLAVRKLRGSLDAAALQRSGELAAEEARLEQILAGEAEQVVETRTTPERVQDALPADAALIEYTLYRPYDPLGKPRFGAPRYAAFVLAHQGRPRAIDLGERTKIDAAVSAFQKALQNKDAAVAVPAHALEALLFEPLRASLGKLRRIYVAPDAALNLVPFAALVDGKRHFLVEEITFSYLTSGRELLRRPTVEPRQGPIVIANPDFDGAREDDATATSRGLRAQDFSLRHFGPLAGTAGEADGVRAYLPGATVLERDQATESMLKRVAAPVVLHIATHGFFLPPTTLGESPLLRSGIVLAGVNRLRSGDDDGVLTALEAASLDLWGTRLVVLSACETGLGDLDSGDGVYGLRRALVLAGAETQVISLWRVDDRATRDLMVGFYHNLQAGRAEALRRVQLQMLRGSSQARGDSRGARMEDEGPRPVRDTSHPSYWAGFILSGADGPLRLDDKIARTPMLDDDARQRWFHAASTGDLAEMQNSLRAGMAIDARDDRGQTALIAAAAAGRDKAVELLLSRGADEDAADRQRMTALAWAAFGDHGAVVERLLARGADPFATNTFDDTPAALARARGDERLARRLAVDGLVATTLGPLDNTKLWTQLKDALSGCHLERVRLLVAHADKPLLVAHGRELLQLAVGACQQPEVLSLLPFDRAWLSGDPAQHETPLGEAIERHHREMVAELLRRGADPDRARVTPPPGAAPFADGALAVAVSLGDSDIVELLLDHGAHLPERIYAGPPPLTKAAERGNARLCDILLAHGASPRASTYDGASAADVAAAEGYADLAERLQRAGAPLAPAFKLIMAIARDDVAAVDALPNVDAVTHEMTPLMVAARFGAHRVLRLLLARGATVNQATSRATALSQAVERALRTRDVEGVRLLLEHGASTAPQIHETAPLVRAVPEGSVSLVRALIDHGARLAPGDEEQTVGSATTFDRLGSLALLLRTGARPGQRTVDWARSLAFRTLLDLLDHAGQPRAPATQLLVAADLGDRAALTRLLAAGVDVDTQDDEGETALIKAAQEGYAPIVAMLLDRGADPTIAAQFNRGGSTALERARSRGYADIVRVLEAAQRRTGRK